MEGHFHIFALASEFPFSADVGAAATRQASKTSSIILDVSTTKLAIAACVAHESTHFATFTSCPASIALHMAEHEIYNHKLGILTRHGRTYYTDEIRPEYSPEQIQRRDILADYLLLDQAISARDLLWNFGRYPVNKISEFRAALGKNPRILDHPLDPFVPHVELPNDDEVEQTKLGPSMESIIEGLAIIEELAFLHRLPLDRRAKAQQLADQLEQRYRASGRYFGAIKFVQDATGSKGGLVLALLTLAVCGPCIGTDVVSWPEFHPTLRLRAMAQAAASLPSVLRDVPLSPALLAEVIGEIDLQMARTLNWRSAASNIEAALKAIEPLTNHKGINVLPALRIRDYLHQKSNNLAFPYQVPRPDFVLQPPVSFCRDQALLAPANAQETTAMLDYLRIVAMQFACRYLISRHPTTSEDEKTARRIHKLVRARFEKARVASIDRLFPADYDRFVDEVIVTGG